MKKIKNVFYLAGPLGLVAFMLMDYIGGMNYPGFNWLNQSLTDLTAIDSYCLPISLTFSIIAGILIVVAAFISYKFFKGFKTNKGFVKGIVCVLITALIVGVGMNVCLVPEAGVSSVLRDTYSAINEQQDAIKEANDKITEIENAPEESSSTDEDSDESTTVISASEKEELTSTSKETIETANQKIEELSEIIKEKMSNPLLIAKLVCIALMMFFFIVSCLILAISGLRKKGIKTIGIFSTCLLFTFAAALICDHFWINTYVGITARWMLYCPYLLVAFISGWIYVYEPAGK